MFFFEKVSKNFCILGFVHVAVSVRDVTMAREKKSSVLSFKKEYSYTNGPKV